MLLWVSPKPWVRNLVELTIIDACHCSTAFDFDLPSGIASVPAPPPSAPFTPPLSLPNSMPPYSHSVDAVQVFTVDVPPAAPVAAKKPVMLGRSESSPSSCSETGDHEDASPRKINRWQQLRQMVHMLTGLSIETEAEPTIINTTAVAPVATVPLGRRRRSRTSFGGSSPILLLHYDFWLEAIDEKHRYGFHLRAFHEQWKREMADVTEASLGGDADRSFFYWLDHGNGSRLELPHCDRNALNATRVQYCSVEQRRQFEVKFTGPQLAFVESHTPVQTDSLSKWIFVLSQDGRLYVARKLKGFFHHSSFLAGVPVVAAGKIYVADGKIYAIEPHSGHFKPKLGSVQAICSVLQAHGVDAQTIHFIKPRKWKDPWPFAEEAPVETIGEDEVVSDSEDS